MPGGPGGGGGGMEEAVQLMRAPWLKGVNREWHCGGGTLVRAHHKQQLRFQLAFLPDQLCVSSQQC